VAATPPPPRSAAAPPDASCTFSPQGAAAHIPHPGNGSAPPSAARLEGCVLALARGNGDAEERWSLGPVTAAEAARTGSILVVEYGADGAPSRARQLRLGSRAARRSGGAPIGGSRSARG